MLTQESGDECIGSAGSVRLGIEESLAPDSLEALCCVLEQDTLYSA